MRLTDAAIARLRPREREYTVWDRSMPGLGVRVRPTSGRSYVLLQEIDGRSKRVSLGPASLKSIAEVRRECHERRARAEPEREARTAEAPKRTAPLFRDFVAGAWKEAHFDGYKPSTQRNATYVLTGRLLPAFGSKPLDRLTPAQVRRWFDAFSRTPIAAASPMTASKKSRGKSVASNEKAMSQALHEMMGVDLTAIPTIGINTALVIASEIGPDFSAFPTVQHFCSWLGVAPGTRISGGKSLPGRAHKVVNPVAQALRIAAMTARSSQSFIGAKHRARLARKDKPVAITATARELACLIYLMVTRGEEYVEQGMEVYEQRRINRTFAHLDRRAKQLGYELVQIVEDGKEQEFARSTA